MSEAEKSVEIEDVLSSIRRLVAERPQAASNPQQSADNSLRARKPVQENTSAEVANTANASSQPTNFVDTINASIARMTQPDEVVPASENNELPIEEPAAIEQPVQEPIIEDPLANVDAFLAQEAENGFQSDNSGHDDIQMTEPFVLRPEMVADVSNIEPDTADIPNDDIADAELETALQDLPEDVDVSEAAAEEASQETGAQFIDEEVLREIVSELVRSELQGDLGDRITRNVRKLVRREIHHALATRDFT